MTFPNIFFATPPAAEDHDDLSQALSVLSEEEIARADRFVFDEHRRRFVAGRALIRRALSEYAAVAPADWRFTTNDHGRPEIAHPASGRHLRFSASRTEGVVMCAVSENGEIGADIERLRPYPTAIVERYLSGAEADAIRAVPEALRSELFFKVWTLKEAYCKARGIGLAIPLATISFDLAGEQPVLAARPNDDRVAWRFEILSPEPGYVAAVCLEALSGVR